jgi:hypothetical protein
MAPSGATAVPGVPLIEWAQGGLVGAIRARSSLDLRL